MNFLLVLFTCCLLIVYLKFWTDQFSLGKKSLHIRRPEDQKIQKMQGKEAQNISNIIYSKYAKYADMGRICKICQKSPKYAKIAYFMKMHILASSND